MFCFHKLKKIRLLNSIFQLESDWNFDLGRDGQVADSRRRKLPLPDRFQRSFIQQDMAGALHHFHTFGPAFPGDINTQNDQPLLPVPTCLRRVTRFGVGQITGMVALAFTDRRRSRAGNILIFKGGLASPYRQTENVNFPRLLQWTLVVIQECAIVPGIRITAAISSLYRINAPPVSAISRCNPRHRTTVRGNRTWRCG